MRQKKKIEGGKAEPENTEACVKCSKLQNGRQTSFEETEMQAKTTTLSTLKSVLKRSSSQKKEKVTKIPDKIQQQQQSFNNAKHMPIPVKKTKNRVQFDESQNKYFEADYVILIHEEDYDLDDYYDEGSPFDDEDDDGYDEDMAPPKICCSNPSCTNTIALSNYSGYGYGATANGLMDVTYGRGGGGLGLSLTDRARYDFSNHYYDSDYEEINQNTRKSSQVTTNRCENEKCQKCNNYFDFDVTLKPDVGQDFGDQVTLSPPEGYKDGGGQCCPHHHHLHHHHQHQILHHSNHHQGFHQGTANDLSSQQRIAACRNLKFHEGENLSDEEEEEEDGEQYQKNDILMEDNSAPIVNQSFEHADDDTSLRPGETDEEKDKSENLKQRYIVETITMTTVTEQRIVKESGEDDATSSIGDEFKKSGILKGGKFWKNSLNKTHGKLVNYREESDSNNLTEDVEERIENTDKMQNLNEGNDTKSEISAKGEDSLKIDESNMTSPESAELTFTLKLGQHLLMANSLKPNSAMRQLFPGPKFISPPPLENGNDAASEDNGAEGSRLCADEGFSRAFSKSEEDTFSNGFLKAIERNTLRRSLVKYSYEYRNKRLNEQKKNENSLEERIRQLTCGLDEEEESQEDDKKDEIKNEIEPSRSSPQGEETKEEEIALQMPGPPPDLKSVRPSETMPTSSGLGNSAYKKLTDLFSRKSNSQPIVEDINRNLKSESPNMHCDLILNSDNLANAYAQNQRNSFGTLKNFAPKTLSSTDEKKQSLPTMGPLPTCANSENSDKYKLADGGDRFQPAGKESEYSMQDIEDGLKSFEPKKLGNQPDVIAQTPQNETSNDELALFVQQDSGRMEKLKKRYSAADDKSDDDDDYGFNKRPLVKGIQITAAAENLSNATPLPPQQNPRFVNPRESKPSSTTATTTSIQASWPYYSQENADIRLRQFYAMKQTEQTETYGVYGNPQEYRGYAETTAAAAATATATTNYSEYKGLGQQRINYVNHGQRQNVFATTNTFYRCHPVRFGGYSELSNYQFRHPPHSPPPMRRILTSSQPSPVPAEDCKVKVENRVYVSRNNETYGTANVENCSRLKVGVPDGSNLVSLPNDGAKTPESVYDRRTVPNIRNPCLQMKFSPVNYQQGVVPTASIRFSASCAPPAIADESSMVIDPHYAAFPQTPNQNAVGVIRVEQGQQMIRVPVPYATGTPVQVHLMASRLGRCDNSQRPGSPQGAIKVPLPSYNHYLIAKGTQTSQPFSGTATTVTLPPPPSQPAPLPPQPNSTIENHPPVELPKAVDFEKQGKAIAEELQQRQKLALSRNASQEANHQNRVPSGTLAPVSVMASLERGVPEGAASSFVQDCKPLEATDNLPVNASAVSGNTIYYTMNI